MKETSVKHLLMARRDNYGITDIKHLSGQVYTLLLAGNAYRAVILQNSFDYYLKRYHMAQHPPTMVVCFEHTTVLPIHCLSIGRGNLALPYELPETISDIEEQRSTKVGSQVVLGMFLSGMRSVKMLLDEMPYPTRMRYRARAKELGKRLPGRPVRTTFNTVKKQRETA